MSTGRWFGRDIAKAIGDAIRDAGKGFALPVSRTAEEVGVVGGRQFDREGDRWFLGEPDRGFRIKPATSSSDPTPTKDLFPHSLRRHDWEVFKAREFSRQYLEETLPIDIVGPDEEHDLSVTFRLPASTYSEAVAQGRVPADLVTRFSASATVDHTSPGAAAIDQLLDADAKQVSLESAAMKHSDAITVA